MSDHTPATPNPWQQLRQLTPARIALGRAGTSLPTAAQLDFQFAHARARDAVHLPLDHAGLREELQSRGHESLLLHSAAADRHVYLQRPDLGRKLNPEAAGQLRELKAAADAAKAPAPDLAIVIADGLSALATRRHSVPFLDRLMPDLEAEHWRVAPIVVVEQGRVAVADEIGEGLGAQMTLMLIGERPGLSSPDSLGLYFTYGPRVGLTDAYRNCISNVRLEGLSYDTAAFRLMYLMREACRRRLSGVELKDEAEVLTMESGDSPGNFLLWKQG